MTGTLPTSTPVLVDERTQLINLVTMAMRSLLDEDSAADVYGDYDVSISEAAQAVVDAITAQPAMVARPVALGSTPRSGRMEQREFRVAVCHSLGLLADTPDRDVLARIAALRATGQR